MSKADILKSYVPLFIGQSGIYQTIYSSQGSELENLDTVTSDILNQCFIETATWGLKYWESFLKILVDESRSYVERRAVVKSKIRGTGTVTVGLIKNVAESFQDGEVEITENVADYYFEVKFIGKRGIPSNLNDLKGAMNNIKPAHLGITYRFTYLTWGELKRANRTWRQLKDLKLTWAALKVLKLA